jgi:drug/metabolite transporter (DMT)-like permease
VILIVPLMGTLCYVPLGLWGSGPSALTTVTPWQWVAILAAGVLNLGAFAAYTKGLQSTPVASANVLNASQVALGAVTGILLFAEPPGPWLTLGIVLTIAGMILIGRSAGEGPTTPETPI